MRSLHLPLTGLLLLFFLPGMTQYVRNGSAQQLTCNCYQLTPATANQSGSVWNSTRIDLNNPFDFWFKVFLGCNDANGADGIVFMLQPLSTNVGSTGEGMGFGGVSPSIGIALDTYQNGNLSDPSYDHISIQANGVITHANDLAGPMPISSTSDNVEDCQWHKLRIAWDPATGWLRTWFDGVPRVSRQIDLVNTIFGGNSLVYWGFSGATGGSTNIQQFCTALDPLFSIPAASNIACVGTPVSFTDASESFAPIASWHWDFGDAQTSNLQNPVHTYLQPGTYPVKLTITGLDGCSRDSIIQLRVPAKPVARFEVYDTCNGNRPRLTRDSLEGLLYEWKLDLQAPSSAVPDLTGLLPGSHQLQLIVRSVYGCGQPDTLVRSFSILPKPVIDALADSGCAGESLAFLALQTDNQSTVQTWRWNFGDGSTGTSATAQHSFNNAGNYNVGVWAIATNGCVSDTVRRTVVVAKAVAFAGNDTTIIRNRPFTLQAQGNGTAIWTPPSGISSDTVIRPSVTIDGDRAYILRITTAEGCTATDTVHLKVFDGPAIYVPTAFTPNGDGLNDVVLPQYVGIRQLEEFAIYNRWGQCLFRTNSMSRGWDGGGTNGAATQTFVWTVRAVDVSGQQITQKGTLTLIR